MNNGKNVDSANLCMVFSVSLVFCLATIGVGVFRCGDSGCRTFYFEGRRVCSMEFMGTKEAAEKMNVKQSTVSAWCREGRIPNAEQDAKGSPWRIPANFTRQNLLPKQNNR